jgi:hypothetical protein
MVYALVALAAVPGWLLALQLASIVRQERRQHFRERDLLLNQLLHAVGNPWQPAPAEERPALVELEPEPRAWTPTPEQLP